MKEKGAASIFEFVSFSAYLSTRLRELQTPETGDPILHVERHLGLGPRSLLSVVASGTRRPTTSLLAKLCEFLALSPLESEYAHLLSQREFTRSDTERKGFEARLAALKSVAAGADGGVPDHGDDVPVSRRTLARLTALTEDLQRVMSEIDWDRRSVARR